MIIVIIAQYTLGKCMVNSIVASKEISQTTPPRRMKVSLCATLIRLPQVFL